MLMNIFLAICEKGALGNTHYMLSNGQRFPSLSLCRKDIESALASAGCQLVNWKELPRCCAPEDKPADHSGVFFCLAQKISLEKSDSFQSDASSKNDDLVRETPVVWVLISTILETKRNLRQNRHFSINQLHSLRIEPRNPTCSTRISYFQLILNWSKFIQHVSRHF